MEQKTQAAPSDADVEAEVSRMLESGCSQREISSSLGISRRQVRKLIDSHKDASLQQKSSKSKLSKARSQILSLSLRSIGVKRSELHDILRETYGERASPTTGQRELDMTENQYQYLTKTVKEKARREGLAALFVPEWMPTENAKQANSMLVSLAGELHQRAQEMTQDFLCHFPECHSGLVLKELVALAFPQPGKEPVELRCERNQEAASELEKRAKPQQSKRSRPASNIAIYCDAEFEALCF